MAKEKVKATTQEALLEKAVMPDDYEDLDVYPRLVDLIMDQKKLKKLPKGETEEQSWHTAKLKGEYAKGTPEEISISITMKARQKADMKRFLKGRMSIDNEFRVTLR